MFYRPLHHTKHWSTQWYRIEPGDAEKVNHPTQESWAAGANIGGPIAIIPAWFPLEDMDRPDIMFLMAPIIRSLELYSTGQIPMPLLLLSSNYATTV